jgi:sulfotransferase family protein
VPKASQQSRHRSRKYFSRLTARLRRRLEQIRYRRSGHDVRKFDAAALQSSGLPRPDFIIIGAPKCGTSWLQRALGQHPEILMVPDEIEYFSMHLDYPVEWYLNHFARAARGGTPPARVLGEKSARYCAIGPDRIAIVHRLLPDAKLVLMTRDPIARHWSQAKRFFSKKRFNKREGGALGIPRAELFDYFERMRPLGEFSTMIANWTGVYPKERLLIVSQEKTLERPREAYDAVLEHVGVSRDYDPAAITRLQTETNPGPQLKMPDDIAAYLENMFAGERERLHTLLGDGTAVYVEG